MRRAIVLGSNGPAELSPLHYAIEDAAAIGRALSSSRCGYQVKNLSTEPRADLIRHLIESEAEQCGPSDTFLCYFSGHGLLERGSLFLLWNETSPQKILSTSIPVEDILRAFQLCRAENKLLILDCCHAGAAVKGFKEAVGIPVEETIKADNFLVLMASDRLENAREVVALKGSFLAHHICRALENDFHLVGDKHSALSVLNLKTWLDRRAQEHNLDNSTEKVPIPYIYGQSRGEFFLISEAKEWLPHTITSPDGCEMIVLPLRLNGQARRSDVQSLYAICIARHPVTNKQYKSAQKSPLNTGMEEERITEPAGKDFVNGEWQATFRPWEDPLFSHDDMPVVCIGLKEARNYVRLLNRRSSKSPVKVTYILPPPEIWDFAAFGTDEPSRAPKAWRTKFRKLHHKNNCPALIDRQGERANEIGVTDMIGNVWEWCYVPSSDDFRFSVLVHSSPKSMEKHRSEIRGGGFRDDLDRIRVFLKAAELEEGIETRHSDLGFRVGGLIPIQHLPTDVQERLLRCRQMEYDFDDFLQYCH